MKNILLTITMVTAAATLSAQKARWAVPRTVDGQPDLQGTWANNNATPLERPVEFAGRATLTDAEVATLKARSARLFNGEGDAAFGDNLFATLLTNPDKFVSVDGRTGDYNHDARVIYMDGRPHPGKTIRHWLGDSRGHWDGDTLVVDTTNFSPKSNFRGSHENLHLIERFTRVSPDRLEYAFTVSDDTTWTRPWSAMIPLVQSNAPIYEYA